MQQDGLIIYRVTDGTAVIDVFVCIEEDTPAPELEFEQHIRVYGRIAWLPPWDETKGLNAFAYHSIMPVTNKDELTLHFADLMLSHLRRTRERVRKEEVQQDLTMSDKS